MPLAIGAGAVVSIAVRVRIQATALHVLSNFDDRKSARIAMVQSGHPLISLLHGPMCNRF